MKLISVEEAVNGFMVTIIWDDEPIEKEIMETKMEVYGMIDTWLGQKINDEQEALRRAAGEVL